MQLDQFLTANPDIEKVFHDKIGVVPFTVFRYRNRKQIPVPEKMVAIYVESGGQVAPNDFYDLPDLATKVAAE